MIIQTKRVCDHMAELSVIIIDVAIFADFDEKLSRVRFSQMSKNMSTSTANPRNAADVSQKICKIRIFGTPKSKSSDNVIHIPNGLQTVNAKIEHTS